MFKRHRSCRACGYGSQASQTLKQSTAGMFAQEKREELIPVLDLGIMPLANDFVTMDQECQGFAPLKVMLCPRCSLAQLSVVVNPSVLYANYPYVTSPSHTMKNHFANLRYDLGDENDRIATVLEIGSNDGALMEFFREHGSRCVGIDPAENLCKLARDRGFQVLAELFNAKQASWVHHMIGEPDLIIARHVFAHMDDWKGFVDGLDAVAGKDTLVAIEVPYIEDQMETLSFDQIYHEHLSYVNVRAVEWLLRGTGLRLQKILHYTIHGGSIVLLLRKRSNAKLPDASVKNYIEGEKLGEAEWRKFDTESQSLVRQLAAYVESLNAQGKTVVGYGASAKSCQWLNACGFTPKQIKFICDGTLQKMYKASPGTEIPVIDEGALTRELPEFAVCFAWNFAREIIEKEQIFRQHGGKWIVPLPKFQVI